MIHPPSELERWCRDLGAGRVADVLNVSRAAVDHWRSGRRGYDGRLFLEHCRKMQGFYCVRCEQVTKVLGLLRPIDRAGSADGG